MSRSQKHASSSRALIRSRDCDLRSWTTHDWQDASQQRQKVKVFTPNIRTEGVTESRPCHIRFGFAGLRHCLFLPSCLQRGKRAGECSEQSKEKLINVMESLTVILLTLSSLGQEICHHATTEWPPWCCQSDEASLNFRLCTLDQTNPIPVWSLSFFYYGPSWHNQRNRRYHVVSPVKVMARLAFSSSGWCNEPYLIPWLLFTSPSVSFSSSGYKRPAVRTEFLKSI